MKITGVITEYNPFHKGHLYHLDNAKRDTNCDGIICIMSGNFMQRGNPAIIDKWNRAKMAILSGVDLVIELPLIYSLSSAENFAYGAVNILNSTGVVDYIYFGSEHSNINDLETIAHLLTNENDSFKTLLKEELSTGIPYHAARANSISKTLKDIPCDEILKNSNNILSIEYLKALKNIQSSIKPKILKREGSNYNDITLNDTFSSATSIRKILKENLNVSLIKDAVPITSYDVINELKNSNYDFVFEESMFKYLKYKILTEGEELKSIQDVSEGIDNKIIKEITNCTSFEDLIAKVKSKRYTYTRINRILTSFFIGLENYNIKNLYKSPPSYIRPLAFNNVGRKILKEIKEKESINIVTKIPKNSDNTMLNLDLLGTRAYSMLNSNVSPIDDYLKSPIFFK